MTRATVGVAAAVVLGLGLGIARTAQAHPAGLTSVSRFVGVSCDARGQVHLAYLLDFAELPAYAEIERLDADHDGTVSPGEQRAYLDQRLPPIVAAWTVEVDGAKASLRITGSSLEVPPGERGLSTLRIAADVVAVRPPDAQLVSAGEGDVRVRVVEPVFGERSGWREMAAEDSTDATVAVGPTARPADILSYSNPLAGGPPRVDEGRFVFRLRRVASEAPIAAVRPDPPIAVDPGLARLASAMKGAEGSWPFSAIALGLAFALGAAHALSPGHGKALAAAYLVGRRARPGHAFLFGAAVTVAHTTVVFVVGCLALAVEHTLGSDRLLRGLALASAVTVVALGIVQLSGRWREVTGHVGGHSHGHGLEPLAESGGLRALVALGASAGLAPCPSALALLLSAIALHRYGFGLILVVAFSLGVATTLAAAGLLVVMARRLLDRIEGAAPVLRWLPVMSSMCVLLLGILLCASAWSPAARYGPSSVRYLVGGGGGGGGTLSTETHAERSKKRYSSAFCCAVIGAPLQPLGMLSTWLVRLLLVCKSVKTALPQ
jgi:nickel/cobalt exporter